MDVLHAVVSDDVDAIRALVEANWEEFNVTPSECLYAAVCRNKDEYNLDMLAALLKCGASASEPRTDGAAHPHLVTQETALHRACCVGHEEAVTLLMNTVDPTWIAANMKSLLSYTIPEERVEVARLLLAHPIATDEHAHVLAGLAVMNECLSMLELAVNATRSEFPSEKLNKMSASACELASMDVLDFLLGKGADPLQVGAEDGINETALHRAVKIGNYEALERLWTVGGEAVINARAGRRKETPLAIAIGNGDVRMVEILLAHGADGNTPDEGNRISLHHLAATNCVDIAEMLLAVPAIKENIDARQTNQFTPLQEAVRRRNFPISRVLVEHGANPNTESVKNWTPLHHACYHGDAELTKLLIDSGADVHHMNTYMVTPFLRACRSDSVETVALVLEAGADLFSKDKNMDTGLHYAAYAGASRTIQYLVERGLDVNCVNSELASPLHDAASKGHFHAVEVLDWVGADFSLVNRANQTALHIAAKLDHKDLIPFLLKVAPDCANVCDSVAKLPGIPADLIDVRYEWSPEIHCNSAPLKRSVIETVILSQPHSGNPLLPRELLFEIFRLL